MRLYIELYLPIARRVESLYLCKMFRWNADKIDVPGDRITGEQLLADRSTALVNGDGI